MPVTVQTEKSIAREFFDAGDYRTCLELTSEPNSLDAFLLRSCCMYEMGLFTEGLAELELGSNLVDDAAVIKKAKYYGQRALVLSKLGEKDKALIDYEAARYWAGQSDDRVVEAIIRNNLAKIYRESERSDEALVEIDLAIKTFTLESDYWNLGRSLDQKAQILLKLERYQEGIEVAKRAVEILGQHGNETTLTEARLTYGKLLVRYGAEFIESDDPVVTFRTKREFLTLFEVELTAEIVQAALDKNGGQVYKAAQELKVFHPNLIKAIEKFGLTRKPKRRRAKSLPKK